MMPALKVNNLAKTFPLKKPLFGPAPPGVRAVRPMSFEVVKGETLGVVGESGCGKSTLARMLVGLLDPSEGTIEIEGQALYNSDSAEFGKLIQYVFQDPQSSLNPRKTIRQVMEAPLKCLHGMTKPDRDRRISEIFASVNLREDFLDRYPHEFSGGMRQRVMIAMALITDPEVLIADEPTTALDVTVQAQILRLLKELQADLGVSVIFITHDLGVIAELADRVVVMYRGHIVEQGDVLSIFDHPQHPYTKGLLACRPRLESTFKVLPTVSDYL
ncbi:MAG TPA: peptide ABC transporter ATP-binding protein, partial [Gammaproteobacteria bacterium]|nr:peptide ABC transporter ATP-binding protein [Gammaproteobacteria bacterium]